MSDKTYRSIDLFAGIGGIRLGFEQAFGSSLETVFVSEFDRFARQTYEANFDDSFKIAGDITEIEAKDIPSHDILCGGFPCQPFSISGRQQGFNDSYKNRTRGTLFFDILRIADYHKTPVLFLENVKNLVHHDRGNTFKVISKALDDAGYELFWDVLCAYDYGLPQTRERTYMIAFRRDIAPESFVLAADAEDIAGRKKARLADILEKDAPDRYYISQKYLDGLRRHKSRHEGKGNGFGYIVRDQNGPASTLTCSRSSLERNLLCQPKEPGHAWGDYPSSRASVNSDGLRTLMPRECARLQGFPEDFAIPVSDSQAYRQFGNSVSVPVIEMLAKKVKAHLDTLGEQDSD